ncbi:MAG: hypothetical protein AAF481_06485 [Acidobacteriota bacterium]
MTRQDGERERLSRALREGAGRTERSSDIASETVWAAVRGELPPAELRELLDRSIEDPDLALEWQLARELQAELAEDERQRSEMATPPSRWRGLSAVAAALLVAVMASWFIFQPEQKPVYRDPAGAAIESLLPADAELSSESLVLRWSGPPEGRYRISVLRQTDLREVFRAADLEVGPDGEGAVELPPTVVDGLAADGVLLWRVEAELPDGEPLQSQTFRVLWKPDLVELPEASRPAPGE